MRKIHESFFRCLDGLPSAYSGRASVFIEIASPSLQSFLSAINIERCIHEPGQVRYVLVTNPQTFVKTCRGLPIHQIRA